MAKWKSAKREPTANAADSPGLYALGLPVLRRRKSTFLYGIEDDAREVIGELGAHLAGSSKMGSPDWSRTP
jgi:hypothetical protein